MARVVFNNILGGWFVVRGPHHTPLAGRFESRAAAQAYLARKAQPTQDPRINGYNVEFLGAQPARAGEDY